MSFTFSFGAAVVLVNHDDGTIVELGGRLLSSLLQCVLFGHSRRIELKVLWDLVHGLGISRHFENRDFLLGLSVLLSLLLLQGRLS